MAYGDYKDFKKRMIADKVLRDKAFNITCDQKYDGYQRGLASMFYKFFDKKSSGSGITAVKPDELQLSKKSRKEKFIHGLETIFEGLI